MPSKGKGFKLVTGTSATLDVVELEDEVEAWLSLPGNDEFKGMKFTRAELVGSYHRSTCPWDPSPLPHASVELENAELRSRGLYQVLHYRTGSGPKVWAPDLGDRVEQALYKKKRAAKKARAKANAEARNKAEGASSSKVSKPSSKTSAPPRKQ